MENVSFMGKAQDKDFAIITAVFILITYGGALFLQNIIDYSNIAFKNWRAKRDDRLPPM